MSLSVNSEIGVCHLCGELRNRLFFCSKGIEEHNICYGCAKVKFKV